MSEATEAQVQAGLRVRREHTPREQTMTGPWWCRCGQRGDSQSPGMSMTDHQMRAVADAVVAAGPVDAELAVHADCTPDHCDALRLAREDATNALAGAEDAEGDVARLEAELAAVVAERDALTKRLGQ